MSRRPHWDDDLIASVMTHCNDIEQCHAAIAAVEDWHKAKRDSRIRTHSEGCWRWHNECAEWLIESQMAAMKRVREVCDKPTMRTTDISGVTEWVRVRDIESALDGGTE